MTPKAPLAPALAALALLLAACSDPPPVGAGAPSKYHRERD